MPGFAPLPAARPGKGLGRAKAPGLAKTSATLSKPKLPPAPAPSASARAGGATPSGAAGGLQRSQRTAALGKPSGMGGSLGSYGGGGGKAKAKKK